MERRIDVCGVTTFLVVCLGVATAKALGDGCPAATANTTRDQADDTHNDSDHHQSSGSSRIASITAVRVGHFLVGHGAGYALCAVRAARAV